MATVKGDIRLNDFMTRNLRNITQAINMTVSELEKMAQKVGKNVDASGLNRIREAVSKVDIELENAVEEQEKLNQKVKQTANSYSGLGRMIKTALGALGINKLIRLSDQSTQVTARLKIMSGGTDEQVEALQNQIYASAQRSRADYFATADVVSKLGLRAGDAFGNTNDIIKFSENLNKMFVIAGASQTEISSASLQLTQALGSGVLRGEELNAVFEAAPNIIQTIADYMDVPIGKIRELASEGKITADVIKNAMLDEETINKVNADFESIPMTWGQVWTMTVNKIIQISQPLLDFISLLAQNWAIIEPIVLGLAIAIGVLGTAMLMYKGYLAISTIIQNGFNNAVLKCPLVWFAAIMLAVIAVLIYLWNTNDKVAEAFIWAWDMVQLGIMQFGIGLKTIFFGALDIIGQFKVGGLTIIDGFINGAIDLINGFITILNKIPGVSIDLITNRSTMGKDAALEFAKEKAERDSELLADADAYWKKKNELDATRDERVANRATLDLGGAMDNLLGDGLNVGNVANVENVEGEVDVASEDLKLIRELAEQQYIQNYISNAPVQYITIGDIHENADIDYLIDGVRENLSEAINTSMEGVPVG